MAINKLKAKSVSDICDTIVREPSTIKKDAEIKEVLQKIIENPITRHLFIIDDDNKLIGSIRTNRILEHLTPDLIIENKEYSGLSESDFFRYFQALEVYNAWDLADKKPISVKLDTTVSDVLKIMHKEKINELPVINENGFLVGEVNLLEIITAYVDLI